MEPRMILLEPFTVLGVVAQIRRGSETPELVGGIWRQFESRQLKIRALAVGDQYLGLSLPTGREDVTDCLAGMAVDTDASVPEGLNKRPVPTCQFAVFECPVQAMGETYRHIVTTWLPHASVQLDPAVPAFEEYSGRTWVANTAGDPVSTTSREPTERAGWVSRRRIRRR